MDSNKWHEWREIWSDRCERKESLTRSNSSYYLHFLINSLRHSHSLLPLLDPLTSNSLPTPQLTIPVSHTQLTPHSPTHHPGISHPTHSPLPNSPSRYLTPNSLPRDTGMVSWGVGSELGVRYRDGELGSGE